MRRFGTRLFTFILNVAVDGENARLTESGVRLRG